MEKSTDGLGEMLQGLGIRPPTLEDAGLEDCALPPESIMEAFSRAATSLKARIVDGLEADGDCIQDPGPSNGQIPDALIGPHGGRPTLGGCGGGGGNVTAAEGVGGDKVVVVGDEAAAASDRVVILGGDGEGGEKSCCPTQVGGDVGEKGAVAYVVDDDGDGEGDGAHGDQPILVEDLI